MFQVSLVDRVNQLGQGCLMVQPVQELQLVQDHQRFPEFQCFQLALMDQTAQFLLVVLLNQDRQKVPLRPMNLEVPMVLEGPEVLLIQQVLGLHFVLDFLRVQHPLQVLLVPVFRENRRAQQNQEIQVRQFLQGFPENLDFHLVQVNQLIQVNH